MVKFSLILCTLNRVDEICDFFSSLENQSFKDFECIVVDQNDDDRLNVAIEHFQTKFPIKYIKSDKKGLSISRNLGLTLVEGEVIAFPDDDCKYDVSTLKQVTCFFDSNPKVDILTINFSDPDTGGCFNKCQQQKLLSRTSYYHYTISIGIFVKYKNISDLHFDEKLGVGCYFGSGEESDFVSNLLSIGYSACYDGGICIFHSLAVPQTNIESRSMKYNLGYGALMRKEICSRHKYVFMYSFCYGILIRLVAALLPLKKRKLYYYSFKYRILGFIRYGSLYNADKAK